MDLASNALITLDDLKDFMGIDKEEENESRDNLLKFYINAVSSQIQKKIGRNILAQDYVEKYPGTNSNELVLKNYPVNSIDSVEYVVDNEIIDNMDDYEYELQEGPGILYKNDGWLIEGYSINYMSDKIDFPSKHIKVAYNAGFNEVPFDLQLICAQFISDSYDMDNSKGGTLKEYKISDVSMTFRDEINFNSEQLKTIKSYGGIRF